MLAVDVRSFDAIHLAIAQHLGADLARIVTYDDCLENAAENLGFTVARPTAEQHAANLATSNVKHFPMFKSLRPPYQG